MARYNLKTRNFRRALDPLQRRFSALFSPAEDPLCNHHGSHPTATPSRETAWPPVGRTWHHVLVTIIMISPRVKMQGFVLVLSLSDRTFDLLTWQSYQFSHSEGIKSERSKWAPFKWKHGLSEKVCNLAPDSKRRAMPKLKCSCLSTFSYIILTLTSHFIWL